MKIKQLILQYKFPVFLCAAVLIAAGLVFISMQIYYASGASQLDLSRPEYTSVRSQITADSRTKSIFDAQGEINESVLSGFLGKYKDSSVKIIEADAYAGDVLSDEQLGL